MMDIILHVAGTAGLVETVVEFTYVITNRENFTPFEEVFFLTTGGMEMLGEVMFVLIGLCCFSFYKSVNGLKALVQDPVHCCATYLFTGSSGKEKEEDYGAVSYFAIAVSVLSLMVWATFWPMWGGSFDDDGAEGLRLALSICSLALLGIVFLPCCCSRDRTDWLGMWVIMVLPMYIMQKVFEVYILLSDLERLCPGDLGKALVGFQCTEILSGILILVHLPSWFNSNEKKGAPTELDGPAEREEPQV